MKKAKKRISAAVVKKPKMGIFARAIAKVGGRQKVAAALSWAFLALAAGSTGLAAFLQQVGVVSASIDKDVMAFILGFALLSLSKAFDWLAKPISADEVSEWVEDSVSATVANGHKTVRSAKAARK